jgi:hypothetical protein
MARRKAVDEMIQPSSTRPPPDAPWGQPPAVQQPQPDDDEPDDDDGPPDRPRFVFEAVDSPFAAPSPQRSIASPLFIHESANDPLTVLSVERLTSSGALERLGQIPGNTTDDGLLEHVDWQPGKYRLSPRTIDGRAIRGAAPWVIVMPPDHPLIRAKRSSDSAAPTGNPTTDIKAILDAHAAAAAAQMAALEAKYQAMLDMQAERVRMTNDAAALEKTLIAKHSSDQTESAKQATNQVVELMREERKERSHREEIERKQREAEAKAREEKFERELRLERERRAEELRAEESRHRREIETAEAKRKAEREEDERRYQRRMEEEERRRTREIEDYERRRRSEAEDAEARHKRTLEELRSQVSTQTNPLAAVLPMLTAVQEFKSALGVKEDSEPAPPRSVMGEVMDLVKTYLNAQASIEAAKAGVATIDLDDEEDEEPAAMVVAQPAPIVAPVATPIARIEPVKRSIADIASERANAANLPPKAQKTARQAIATFCEDQAENATKPDATTLLITAALDAIQKEPVVLLYLRAVGLRVALLEGGCAPAATENVIGGAKMAGVLDQLQVPEG